MMQEEVLFTEVQRFRQWWLWLLILGIDCFFLFSIYQQLVLKVPFGDRPMGNFGLLSSAAVPLLLTILFFNLKLITRIQKDGIYVKFFPFHWSYRFYNRQDIAKSYVRTYSPLMEYGGWGIRYSIGGKGMAYNISGNQGLQLELRNGKKVLIGTGKAPELEAILTMHNLS